MPDVRHCNYCDGSVIRYIDDFPIYPHHLNPCEYSTKHFDVLYERETHAPGDCEGPQPNPPEDFPPHDVLAAFEEIGLKFKEPEDLPLELNDDQT